MSARRKIKNQEVRYVYELPYSNRREICKILDVEGDWRTLAGELEYSVDQIKLWENEVQKPGGSPADAVLSRWGHSNCTIKELFKMLKSIGCIRALRHLHEFVPAEYNSDLRSYGTDTIAFKEKSASENDSGESIELPRPPPPPRGLHSKTTACERTDVHASRPGKENLGPVEGTDWPSMKSGGDRMVMTPEYQVPYNAPAPGYSVPARRPPVPVPVEDPAVEMPPMPSSVKLLEQDMALKCCHSFTYSEIKASCSNFHSKTILGHGGFGKVYRGELKATQVAIKVMLPMPGMECEGSMLPTHLFAEIKTLLRYRHDNIIPLFGYSDDGPELCLVYQFMANGSLEDKLACKGGTQLAWSLRSHILLGAARGITYLHTATNTALIHGDIKSANILLDRHFEAKVSDFGLAKEANAGSGSKFTRRSRTDENSKVYGTRAYLPEDFFRSYTYSTKTDVFSFGVVIYECCTGDRAFDQRREGGNNLWQYVANVIATGNKDKLLQIRDPHAGSWPISQWHELLKLGESCTAAMKGQRPEITEVLSRLQMQNGKDIAIIQEMRSNLPPASVREELSYQVSHVGDGKGVSPKDGPPAKPYIGIELQQMKMESFKKSGGEDQAFASDPEKLRLIEEHDQGIDYPRPSSGANDADTVDPKTLESDPDKLRQLNEFDQQPSVRRSSSKEESVPYLLQKAYDMNSPITVKNELDSFVPLPSPCSSSAPTAVLPEYVNFPMRPGSRRSVPDQHYVNVPNPTRHSDPPSYKRNLSEHNYVNIRRQEPGNPQEKHQMDIESRPLPPEPQLQQPLTVTECVQNLENMGIEDSIVCLQMEGNLPTHHVDQQCNATEEIVDQKKAKEWPDHLAGVFDDFSCESDGTTGRTLVESSHLATHSSHTGTPSMPPIYSNCSDK